MDIRECEHLSGKQVLALNFINSDGSWLFRKFYRSGLRSHIFEVVSKEDIEKESKGELIDGIRLFPRAKPQKMLRILRSRFQDKYAVFHEINKYNLLLDCLGPDLIACSDEFIVDYTGTGRHEIVLCGLQEYVEGDILDPWRIYGTHYLSHLFQAKTDSRSRTNALINKARNSICRFVDNIHSMILRKGFIPDLAGIGNLIITSNGNLKLVDINNIVEIHLDNTIRMDDRGYPSCDVSVDALSILEKKILGRSIKKNDPIYATFLQSDRKKRVKELEKRFYKRLTPQSSQ